MCPKDWVLIYISLLNNIKRLEAICKGKGAHIDCGAFTRVRTFRTEKGETSTGWESFSFELFWLSIGSDTKSSASRDIEK